MDGLFLRGTLLGSDVTRLVGAWLARPQKLDRQKHAETVKNDSRGTESCTCHHRSGPLHGCVRNDHPERAMPLAWVMGGHTWDEPVYK